MNLLYFPFNPIKVLFLLFIASTLAMGVGIFQSYQGSIFTREIIKMLKYLQAFNPIKVLFLQRPVGTWHN